MRLSNARTKGAGVALGVALALSSTAMAPPAAATNFGGYYANNRTHYMSYNLTSGWRTATEATRTGSYETTVLTTVLAAHDTSDVFYEVETQSAPYYGSYFCVTPSGATCNHAHVTYNGPNGAGLTALELKHVACHETGHTVGLQHPPVEDAALYRCLVSTSFPDTLGQHNADHINFHY